MVRRSLAILLAGIWITGMAAAAVVASEDFVPHGRNGIRLSLPNGWHVGSQEQIDKIQDTMPQRGAMTPRMLFMGAAPDGKLNVVVMEVPDALTNGATQDIGRWSEEDVVKVCDAVIHTQGVKKKASPCRRRQLDGQYALEIRHMVTAKGKRVENQTLLFNRGEHSLSLMFQYPPAQSRKLGPTIENIIKSFRFDG